MGDKESTVFCNYNTYFEVGDTVNVGGTLFEITKIEGSSVTVKNLSWHLKLWFRLTCAYYKLKRTLK